MSISNIGKQSLGDWLLEAGWQQGTLFRASSARFMWNTLVDIDSETIVQQQRKVKSGEMFVLITQDCDIKALESREPYVEALLCQIEKNRQFLSKIERNSARQFVIDFDKGLVAEAKYRVIFAKQVLQRLTPEPWPGSPKRREQFIRWLARRYDRPAIPDAIIEVFQKPIEALLAQINEEYPDIGVAFSMAVREIRVSLPASEHPPFDLQLLLLVNSRGLRKEESDAIDMFSSRVRTILNPEKVYLHPEVRIVPEEEISMAHYYATRPLFLEYHTYKGEEVEGAEPYGRV